jgi:predicted TIM-barrel enzyme
MAGRGSAAGLLAYGNANEIVKEMAVEVLPVVKHTPVLAGVNGTIRSSSCRASWRN